MSIIEVYGTKPKIYTIDYELDGGSLSDQPTSYTNEDKVTLPTPTKPVHKFLGWYTNGEFTGDQVTEIPKGSTGNKTFYAKWEEIVAATPVIANEEEGYIYGNLQRVLTGGNILTGDDFIVQASAPDGGTLSYTWDLDKYYVGPNFNMDEFLNDVVDPGNTNTLTVAWMDTNTGILGGEQIRGTVKVTNTKDGATASKTCNVSITCVTM